MVGARDRSDKVALVELLSYERESERRPVTCWCRRCGDEYIVHRNPVTQHHLTFEVCSPCAAKAAARLYPKMAVRRKMNGATRWPVPV